MRMLALALMCGALVGGVLLSSTQASASAGTPQCDAGEGLRDRLIRHEGWRACLYNDQYGNPTIGVGHLLPNQTEDGLCWSTERIADLFELDIHKATGHARRNVRDHKAWYGMGRVTREVLIELAFQLGGAGLSHFKKMLAAARRGDQRTAAKELLSSLLAKQIPGRTAELACLLEKEQ